MRRKDRYSLFARALRACAVFSLVVIALSLLTSADCNECDEPVYVDVQLGCLCEPAQKVTLEQLVEKSKVSDDPGNLDPHNYITGKENWPASDDSVSLSSLLDALSKYNAEIQKQKLEVEKQGFILDQRHYDFDWVSGGGLKVERRWDEVVPNVPSSTIERLDNTGIVGVKQWLVLPGEDGNELVITGSIIGSDDSWKAAASQNNSPWDYKTSLDATYTIHLGRGRGKYIAQLPYMIQSQEVLKQCALLSNKESEQQGLLVDNYFALLTTAMEEELLREQFRKTAEIRKQLEYPRMVYQLEIDLDAKLIAMADYAHRQYLLQANITEQMKPSEHVLSFRNPFDATEEEDRIAEVRQYLGGLDPASTVRFNHIIHPLYSVNENLNIEASDTYTDSVMVWHLAIQKQLAWNLKAYLKMARSARLPMYIPPSQIRSTNNPIQVFDSETERGLSELLQYTPTHKTSSFRLPQRTEKQADEEYQEDETQQTSKNLVDSIDSMLDWLETYIYQEPLKPIPAPPTVTSVWDQAERGTLTVSADLNEAILYTKLYYKSLQDTFTSEISDEDVRTHKYNLVLAQNLASQALNEANTQLKTNKKNIDLIDQIVSSLITKDDERIQFLVSKHQALEVNCDTIIDLVGHPINYNISPMINNGHDSFNEMAETINSFNLLESILIDNPSINAIDSTKEILHLWLVNEKKDAYTYNQSLEYHYSRMPELRWWKIFSVDSNLLPPGVKFERAEIRYLLNDDLWDETVANDFELQQYSYELAKALYERDQAEDADKINLDLNLLAHIGESANDDFQNLSWNDNQNIGFELVWNTDGWNMGKGASSKSVRQHKAKFGELNAVAQTSCVNINQCCVELRSKLRAAKRDVMVSQILTEVKLLEEMRSLTEFRNSLANWDGTQSELNDDVIDSLDTYFDTRRELFTEYLKVYKNLYLLELTAGLI